MKKKVLILASHPQPFVNLFPAASCEVSMTDSVIRARQIMSGKGADLVVIAHPLEGSSALEAAGELSGAVEGGLLLFGIYEKSCGI